MRKRIINDAEQAELSEASKNWLDLELLVTVELTSEDASHPIESALTLTGGTGWRSGKPGQQTIRLLFDHPQKITHVHLLFEEEVQARTQEFVLRGISENMTSGREIVRQQYNFSPPTDTREVEDYSVEFDNLVALELTITPDISGGESRASLAQLRLA